MSQTSVTRFYASRKRLKDAVKSTETGQPPKTEVNAAVHLATGVKAQKVKSKNEKLKIDNPKKTVCEKKSKAPIASKKSGKKVSAVENQQDIRTALFTQSKRKGTKLTLKESKKSDSETLATNSGDKFFPVHNIETLSDVPRTPKRNLSDPDELTPSKKLHVVDQSTLPKKIDCIDSEARLKSSDQNVCRKLHLEFQHSNVSEQSVPLNEAVIADNLKHTPKKVSAATRSDNTVIRNKGSCKKVSAVTLSDNAVAKSKGITKKNVISIDTIDNKQSPGKSSSVGELDNNLVSLVKQSRSKILNSGNLDELRKSLQKFSKAAAATEQHLSNSCKITAVIGTNTSSNTQRSVLNCEHMKHKLSYLAASDSSTSLTLPYKYKLICETFRCMDVVISILHNRKEKITFEKVQEGVQKMNNRTFTKTHIGQIISVLPSAYTLYYDKCDGNIITKSDTPGYQLIIEPNLVQCKDSADSCQDIKQCSKSRKPVKSGAFVHMSPQHLMERRISFHQSILKLVKKYHLEFLTRINFPVVSEKSILRWHPKFQVDSVPDVKSVNLPETPEIKLCTAKDVLNKLRGTVKGRVQKALESVSEESNHCNNSDELVSKNTTTLNRTPSNALKGICTDLLEKIRARESAKLVQTMMRPPEETKRLAMMENVPKIVHILWHYFIAERKAAVSVEVAVEKIIHSFNSRKTPEEIKEHLQLITETFPGWLSFIKISKGEYITMDKKKDINVMLKNLKC